MKKLSPKFCDSWPVKCARHSVLAWAYQSQYDSQTLEGFFQEVALIGKYNALRR